MKKARGFQTEQQRQTRALLGAIGRARGEMGLKYDQDVADLIGVGRSTYNQMKKADFQGIKYKTFCIMAKRLGLTGREVCAAVGVPYEEPNR